ncbi:MAG: DUF2279 domain-containing protein [Saprospiraceae bacterium]|nr:DUF2279 domain-containing protein [Saprospiraceae bacterium]|tara:strand:+ start:1186 stop:2151 length:966 start_codon:yes stop_codon:yes gene_type:complete
MKEKLASFIIVMVLFSFESNPILCQSDLDSVGRKRLVWTSSALGLGYGTSTYLLNEVWYKDYPRSSFHFFNDWGEWNRMDKIGHVFSSQFQSNYAYHLYKWSGLSEKRSILYGSVTSLMFQSTVELLDGFSSQWGFSGYDFGANIMGTSLFAIQQSLWGEQKIMFKVSGGKRNYEKIALAENGNNISLNQRANELFGKSVASRFLKDYNSQTYWVSFNINSLSKAQKWPAWLNMSIGYGAENLYGGFENEWVENNNLITLSKQEYPRYHQVYFSPDIDLTKIKTQSRLLKTVFGVLNIFKFPLPALEWSSQGGFSFHFLKF